MSQESVYNILKKKKAKMTAKEIAKELNQGSGSVIVSLNKLLKQRVIERDPPIIKQDLFYNGKKPYLWKII